MPTFIAMRWTRLRSQTGRATLAGQDGFLLIEVIVSAMLVGLIVIATLTGFDVLNRVSADERFHNQAAVLAAESQEQLRGDPASTLQVLEASPHTYTQTIGGTTYTIVQKTELQPASGSNAACSVTENKRQSGNAFRITSTVTWPQQLKAKRPSVVASSIVTPPTGSDIEVDAGNAPTVTSGVSGITATVKYKPVGSGALVTVERTTGAEGCVLFGGIPSTAATVEIGEVAGYFTRAGVAKYPTKEVSIAPNYTTHYPILYNRGGAVKAEFVYKAAPKYVHPNNEGTGNVEELVTGDTFVTFNALMEAAPDYEVGSTRYAVPTTVYNPLPGTYEASGASPSNLFPFAATEAPWIAYAGDCVENNPKEVTAGVVKPAENVFVTPGGTALAQVPTSLVTLNLYKGTEAAVNALPVASRWKELETTTAQPVTVTNSECAGTTPNNESPVSVKHRQETTTGNLNGGHLARPFQPFGGEYELCVYVSPNAYTRTYEDKETKGPAVPIYLGQKSTQEKNTARETAVAAETAEKADWAKKRAKNEITGAQLTTEENAQTVTREARKTQEAKEASEAANSKVTVETSAGCP
jgi:type II secretory pathway pseudopilin PulG